MIIFSLLHPNTPYIFQRYLYTVRGFLSCHVRSPLCYKHNVPNFGNLIVSLVIDLYDQVGTIASCPRNTDTSGNVPNSEHRSMMILVSVHVCTVLCWNNFYLLPQRVAPPLYGHCPAGDKPESSEIRLR